MRNGPQNRRNLARGPVIFLQKLILGLSRYWYTLAILLAFGILGLAFLAPALMAAGEPQAGLTVYRWLAPHDHQLPQRSYFLFGAGAAVQSYSREQIIAWGADPGNLRAFVGNPEIGFKMGLNHRMTAIFIAIFLGGLWWGGRRGHPRLDLVWLLLLSLPLLADGLSHTASERSGLGFRAVNGWAATLTGGAFSPEFYTGSTIGSLNWLLRTVTGLLFGLGLVWFLFTYLSNRFAQIRARLGLKLKR